MILLVTENKACGRSEKKKVWKITRMETEVCNSSNEKERRAQEMGGFGATVRTAGLAPEQGHHWGSHQEVTRSCLHFEETTLAARGHAS